MMPGDSTDDTVPGGPVLDDLRGLATPFVIVGGVATTLYMPQRLTQDLDILIVVADAARLHRELAALGATRTGDLSIGGSSWDLPDGLALDVLESTAPWARAAVEQPARSREGWPVIPLPYLVAMKVEAGRERDLRDVATMLAHADEAAVEEVRAAVGRYVPDAAEDLESLRVIGQLERQEQERQAPGRDRTGGDRGGR
jgi:hypothetical protein